LRDYFSGQKLTLVLEAYMAGIKNVFIFAIAGATASILLALLIPPTRLPAPQEDGERDEKAANAAGDG
jgi:MFS transporter, DHA2 family, glioxin efflux transporter